jgi:hypothetical protein
MRIDYRQIALDMNREICGGDPHKATALLEAAIRAETGETYAANMKGYLLDQFRILFEIIAKLSDEVERWEA